MREKYILAIRVLGTLIALEIILAAGFILSPSSQGRQLVPTISIQYDRDGVPVAGVDASGNPLTDQTLDPSMVYGDDYWERQTGEALLDQEAGQESFVTTETVEPYPAPQDGSYDGSYDGGYPAPENSGGLNLDPGDIPPPPGDPWDEWGGTGGVYVNPPAVNLDDESASQEQPQPTQPASGATQAQPTQAASVPTPPPPPPSPTQPPSSNAGSPTQAPPAPTQPAPAPPSGSLLSARVPGSPEIDGRPADSAWQNAQALDIQTQGGANASATTVTLKSVHDDERVYFLLSWADPQQSYLYQPWEKQAGDSWTRLTGDQSDENTFAEDKISLMWPISQVADFSTQGCGLACHTGENPETKPYGNKYLPQENQVADLWVWKSVRNLGQVDDLYLDGTRYSDETKYAGRKSDPSGGGGYETNQSENRKRPEYMPPGGGDRSGAPGFILLSESAAFDDGLFPPGSRVPSILKSAFEGDRGDIRAAWQYQDGRWWLEISRALVTGSKVDIQFDNFDRGYAFALATFDNTQLRHAVQSGAVALWFEK